MVAEDWVIEAKAARRQGRFQDAAAQYEHAAQVFQTDGELARWAHALRHAAELAVESGDKETGLRDARAVVDFYRGNAPARLEMANALRVLALAEAANGHVAAARQCWGEAHGLYQAEGIQNGVADAERHLNKLPVD